MHFEILVEDASGSILLERVLPRILGTGEDAATYRIHPYKGIGHVPRGLKPGTDPDKRILLDQLPRLLRGYGRSLWGQEAVVVVVFDQDRRDCHALKSELLEVLKACDPAPICLFRIAIEEMESWLLGDRKATMASDTRSFCSAKSRRSLCVRRLRSISSSVFVPSSCSAASNLWRRDSASASRRAASAWSRVSSELQRGLARRHEAQPRLEVLLRQPVQLPPQLFKPAGFERNARVRLLEVEQHLMHVGGEPMQRVVDASTNYLGFRCVRTTTP